MSQILQSGMHPDADSLTAFAEQLLSPDERDQVLAHMAACGRCREVVFLAQHARAEDVVAQTVPKTTHTQKIRVSWFGGWRWAWIPAGAFALLMGFAVLFHWQHAETDKEIALSTADKVERATPAQNPVSPAPVVNQAQAIESAKVSPKTANKALREEKDASRDSEDKKTTMRQGYGVGKAAPTIAPVPGISAGSIHGDVATRAVASPYGGPMANNQMQQQNMTMQQNEIQQQNGLVTTQNAEQATANKPVVNSVPVGSASETVTVQAGNQPETKAAAPSTQLSYARGLELAPTAIGNLKKSPKFVLPSGTEALSTASSATRVIAIDTAGALFLSIDDGKHWEPIATQWTGRAVLVRNAQAVPGTAGLQAAPSTHFELVNDKLQKWVSSDGKTWIRQTLPDK